MQQFRRRITMRLILCGVLLLFTSTATSVLAFEDFCNPKLCHPNVTHIACSNVTGFGADCPAHNSTEVQIDKDLQTLIVDVHNELRSQLANGDVPGMPTASKMIEMVI